MDLSRTGSNLCMTVHDPFEAQSGPVRLCSNSVLAKVGAEFIQGRFSPLQYGFGTNSGLIQDQFRSSNGTLLKKIRVTETQTIENILRKKFFA